MLVFGCLTGSTCDQVMFRKAISFNKNVNKMFTKVYNNAVVPFWLELYVLNDMILEEVGVMS